jgi:hypothetical protein
MGGACSKQEERRNTYKVKFGKPEGKSYLIDISVDGRVILDWTLRNRVQCLWIEFVWIRISGGLL